MYQNIYRAALAYRISLVFLFGLTGVVILTNTPDAAAQMITEPMFKSVQRVEEPEDDHVVRRRVIGFQYEMMEAFVKNPDRDVVASFELFEDLTVLARGVQVDRWSANEFTWHGEFVERHGNMIIEVNTHEEVIFTSFQVGNYSYRINHLEDEWYEILELDLSGLQDHPPDWQDPIEEDPSGTFEPADRDTTFFGTSHTMRPPGFYLRDGGEHRTMAVDGDEDILDVLMLYIEEAADSAGGDTQMVLNIRNAFSNTNTSFAQSGVNARLRSAGIRKVTWVGDPDPDEKNYINALKGAINNSDHDIYQWREEYGADIVGMVYPDGDWCGRVYEVMSEVTDDFRDKAVFVVREGYCLGGNYTFAHEIGHLLGARHDWFMDDTDGSPFDYNHGYVHIEEFGQLQGTVGWRTIMAYDDKCKALNPLDDDEPTCVRKNYWSSPDNTYDGEPMGVASGDEPADNVRTLNNTIPTAAGFEDPAPVVYGIVTDLMTGEGMEEVEMAGIYGPVTDENGFYDVVVRKGKSVLLDPKVLDEELEDMDYEFNPSTPKQLLNVTSNVQQNFTAGIYYNISGIVGVSDNLDPSGVKMTGAPGSTVPTTDQYGRYDFDVLADWEGTIIPQKGEEHDFDPPQREYSNLSADLENEDYTISLTYHAITGTITEAGTSQGVSNVILEGLPAPFPPYATTNTDGGYTRNLKHGWSGTVRPVWIGYNFDPATRTYDGLDSDVEHNYTAIPSAVADSRWPVYGSNASNNGRMDGQPAGDELKWSQTLDGIEVTAGGAGTAPVIDDRGTIYTTSKDGTVYAFHEDGSDDWRRNLGKGVEISAPPAAGSGRLLYVPTIGAISSRLFQLEEEGSLHGYFSVDAPIYTTPAPAQKDTLYIGTDDGHLYALRPSLNLDEEWSFETGDKIRSSPAVGPAGTVYFGSDDGSMYAVNPDGKMLDFFDAGGPVTASPAISRSFVMGEEQEVMYVGVDEGRMYAFNISESQNTPLLYTRWVMTPPGSDAEITSAALSDGELYFVHGDELITLGGEGSGSDDSVFAQFVFAGYAPDQILEMAHIIVWLSHQGGPLGLGGPIDPDEPCPSGPLFIPQCNNEGGSFGDASPLMRHIYPAGCISIGLKPMIIPRHYRCC